MSGYALSLADVFGFGALGFVVGRFAAVPFLLPSPVLAAFVWYRTQYLGLGDAITRPAAVVLGLVGISALVAGTGMRRTWRRRRSR